MSTCEGLGASGTRLNARLRMRVMRDKWLADEEQQEVKRIECTVVTHLSLSEKREAHNNFSFRRYFLFKSFLAFEESRLHFINQTQRYNILTTYVHITKAKVI